LALIYIDASGDLGDNGSRFFVLCALIVEDAAPINRIIKNLRRHKFRKQLRKAVEIKATDSSPEIVASFISRINSLPNAETIFVVLDKRKTHSRFLLEHKHKLYNFVAGKLANNISLKGSATIIIDKSKRNPLLRNDFDRYFTTNLACKDHSSKVKIVHGNSFNFAGLQATDCLAWSCFQKFEFNNAKYLGMLSMRSTVVQVW